MHLQHKKTSQLKRRAIHMQNNTFNTFLTGIITGAALMILLKLTYENKRYISPDDVEIVDYPKDKL